MIEAVGVVVPAHNEELLIGDCLRALNDALCSAQLPVQVCVVADRCTDRTVDVTEAAMPQAVVLRTGARRTLGEVRHLGVREVMKRFSGYERANVWLLGTDADTCVRGEWVERQLCHAAAGADAVTGLVDLQPSPHLTAGVWTSYRRLVSDGLRAHDHDHIHGANFGVRASAYAAVGGYRKRDTGEDRDLWFRLQAAGFSMVQPRDVDVLTSSRTVGRAQGGLADLLATLVARASAG